MAKTREPVELATGLWDEKGVGTQFTFQSRNLLQSELHKTNRSETLGKRVAGVHHPG